MSYVCPRCGSENVQKLSLIHGAGTTGISATTLSTGMGRGHGGIGIAATQGEAQSLLAKRFAPPKPESAAGPIGCLAVLGIVVAVGAGTALDSVVAFWVILALTAALGVAFARQAATHNEDHLPRAKALWQKRFICLRCEEVFEPQLELASQIRMTSAEVSEARSQGQAPEGASTSRSQRYSVRLVSAHDRPVAAIKVIQGLLGLGILEAREMVKTAPNVILSGLSLAEAEAVRAQFESIGAIADIVGYSVPFEVPATSKSPQKEAPAVELLPTSRCCPDCDRPIHSLDGSCSNCQANQAENRPVPAWLWAGIIFVLIVGGATYLSPGKKAPSQTQSHAPSSVQAVAAAPQAILPVPTLRAEVTVQAGLLGPFEISGITNLPEGTLLSIWLEGEYPACTPNCGFELEQTTVRNGRFQATVKGQEPRPGRYTVHVTTAMASTQPAQVGAVLGPSGQNLRGSYIAVLSDGGKYLPVDPERADARRYLSGFLVHYTQRIEIGEGGEVIVCPKRNTADDCELHPQTGTGNEPPAEASQIQPTN